MNGLDQKDPVVASMPSSNRIHLGTHIEKDVYALVISAADRQLQQTAHA
jgi:hypothetical protein